MRSGTAGMRARPIGCGIRVSASLVFHTSNWDRRTGQLRRSEKVVPITRENSRLSGTSVLRCQAEKEGEWFRVWALQEPEGLTRRDGGHISRAISPADAVLCHPQRDRLGERPVPQGGHEWHPRLPHQRPLHRPSPGTDPLSQEPCGECRAASDSGMSQAPFTPPEMRYLPYSRSPAWLLCKNRSGEHQGRNTWSI